MLIGWELVGVCSFVLIGHWWEDKNNTDAALKAFLTNRVGDVGLIIGVIITFFAAGATSFNVLHINQYALSPGANQTLLLVGALCLFGGVTSKSGQFPLHTWLPDAMAGPTPVSALIHAATMVVAGVYLDRPPLLGVLRGPQHRRQLDQLRRRHRRHHHRRSAPSLAFVQTDIKKVLAYSTISQLGYMVMALGVGAWTGAIFHLFTHAFFKACLFLGAGSVSHAAHHTFDMRKMGGLKKYMPTTFWTFVIGTLALMGIFPLAGFWSKDEILAGVAQRPARPRLPVHADHGPHRRADDLRLHDPGHLAHLLRRVPRPRHPARVAQGDDRPAVDPGRRRRRARLRQPARTSFQVGDVAYTTASSTSSSRPSPSRPSTTPSSTSGWRSARPSLAALGIFLAYQYYWLQKSPLIGLTDQSKRLRPGLLGAREQVLPRPPLHRHHRRQRQGPDRPGVLLVQPERHRRASSTPPARRSVATGRRSSTRTSTRGRRRARQRHRRGAEESGEVLRHIQTGRVQQYAALLFAGAVVLAVIFVFFV